MIVNLSKSTKVRDHREIKLLEFTLWYDIEIIDHADK